MKNTLLILSMLITLTGIFSACSNKVIYAKEEEQIREVWNKISKYGEKGDWENYKKYIDQTEKIQLLHPEMGQWIKGWEEFSAFYKGMMEQGITYTALTNDLKVNINKCGDMAWLLAEVILAYDSNPDQKFRMWNSGVFEKIDGEWKMVMGMACSVPNAE